MKAKPSVVNIKLTGDNYKGGYHYSWSVVTLSDNNEIIVPEEIACGFNAVLKAVENKADITSFRNRLDVWIKTGIMPLNA